MNTVPLISVVAINYNNSKYVLQTLDSIAAQDHPNFELIIVDDHSTDDSLSKIETWLTTYQRPARLVVNEQNLGVCATCNRGFRAAQGEFICLIATDDEMVDGRLSKQAAFFARQPIKVGMVHGDASLMDENGEDLSGTFIGRYLSLDEVPSGDIFDELIKGNYIPAMTTMVRRSVFDNVGEFDEGLCYEDYDMWLRIARRYHVAYQDAILAKYRIRSDGLTATKTFEKWQTSLLHILAKHTDDVEARRRMSSLIASFYLRGFDYISLRREYHFEGRGFTYRCMVLGIPAIFPRSLRSVLRIIRWVFKIDRSIG